MTEKRKGYLQRLGGDAIVSLIIALVVFGAGYVTFVSHTKDVELWTYGEIDELKHRMESLEERERNTIPTLSKLVQKVDDLHIDMQRIETQLYAIHTRLIKDD